MGKLNTPNKLTVLRIILIPFFIFALLSDKIFPPGINYLVGGVIFGVASFTDLLDGHIARKQNIVTNFGKLMDPLADKLLVTSAMLCFIEIGVTGSVPVIIIIAREFLVTSVRMIALESGKVIAANIWGKMKTVIQMVSISLVMLLLFVSRAFNIIDFSLIDFSLVEQINSALMWLCAVVTLISGATYIWDNRDLITM